MIQLNKCIRWVRLHGTTKGRCYIFELARCKLCHCCGDGSWCVSVARNRSLCDRRSCHFGRRRYSCSHMRNATAGVELQLKRLNRAKLRGNVTGTEHGICILVVITRVRLKVCRRTLYLNLYGLLCNIRHGHTNWTRS